MGADTDATSDDKSACGHRLQEMLPDKIKTEVLARVALCLFGSYCLGVAHIPTVVPPDFSFFLTLVGTALSFSLPSLLVRVPGLLPTVLAAFILATVYATMLMAALTVSEGLFTAIFAIFCLCMVTLFFGPTYDKTVALANVQIGVAAMLALSHLDVMRENDLDLSYVGSLWTESGLENPNAFFRNFLIAVCWGLAMVAVVVLIPPVRTARDLFATGMVPGALNLVNAVLAGKRQQVQGKFISIWTSIEGGTKANLTLFEPRMFRAPAQSLVPPLKNLMQQVDKLMLYSFLASTWKEGAELSQEEKTALQDTTDIVGACAKALATNDPESTKLLEDSQKSSQSQEQEQPTNNGTARLDETWFLYKQSIQVRDATLVWLEDFHHPKPPDSFKEGMNNICFTTRKIIALPLLPLKRLATASTLVFKPHKWDAFSILWGLKLVVGFVVLFIMRVYWDAYADYAIRPDDGFVGSVFNGWEFLTFAFSWSVTLEGTFKKGVQRLLGTAAGGFVAWLGIIVCSWSYDDTAPINPYGLVAWLTITNLIAAYFDILPGMQARLGAGGVTCHHSWGFFAVTNALIAMETYTGKGTKNDLTANRITATLTGVLTAMVVAAIPPFVKGGDPKHAQGYLTALEEALENTLQMFLSENGRSKIDDDDYKTTFLLQATKLRKAAIFFWTDAARFKRLPVFRVNEELRPLLDDMTVTQALISFLRDFLAGSVDKDVEEPPENAKLQQSIKEILAELGGATVGVDDEEVPVNQENEQSGDDGNDDQNNEKGSDVNDRQIALARTVRDRLRAHKSAVMSLGHPKGAEP